MRLAGSNPSKRGVALPPGPVLSTITLQGQGQGREDDEVGAYRFQRWLQSWKRRGGARVFVALDGTHAVAVEDVSVLPGPGQMELPL